MLVELGDSEPTAPGHLANGPFLFKLIEVVLQILGKVRSRLTVPVDTPKDELERLALSDERIQKLTDGKTIRKVIVVPNKLVNIVAT